LTAIDAIVHQTLQCPQRYDEQRIQYFVGAEDAKILMCKGVFYIIRRVNHHQRINAPIAGAQAFIIDYT
jgi:hypothetical protein